jgi:hypothetical protein
MIPPLHLRHGTVSRCQQCAFDGTGAAVTYHAYWNPTHQLEAIGSFRFNRYTNAWDWFGMDRKRGTFPAREVYESRSPDGDSLLCREAGRGLRVLTERRAFQSCEKALEHDEESGALGRADKNRADGSEPSDSHTNVSQEGDAPR